MTDSKPAYDEGTDDGARRSALRFALREARSVALRPRFWIVIGTAIALTALAGPFGSFERTDLTGRLLYWGLIVILSGAFMTFLSAFMRLWLAPDGDHWFWPATLAGIAGIVPVALMVVGVDTALMADGRPFALREAIISVAPVVVVVTLAVNSFISTAALRGAGKPAADLVPKPELPQVSAPAPQSEPAVTSLVFDKLSPDLGRDIICMQAKDHYVEITTTRGTASVLLRLSDAERDLRGQYGRRGLRPHRSWWINLDHALDLERGRGSLDVVLTGNKHVPVARGQRAVVAKALDRDGSD